MSLLGYTAFAAWVSVPLIGVICEALWDPELAHLLRFYSHEGSPAAFSRSWDQILRAKKILRQAGMPLSQRQAVHWPEARSCSSICSIAQAGGMVVARPGSTANVRAHCNRARIARRALNRPAFSAEFRV
jgi:hypothetical protein